MNERPTEAEILAKKKARFRERFTKNNNPITPELFFYYKLPSLYALNHEGKPVACKVKGYHRVDNYYIFTIEKGMGANAPVVFSRNNPQSHKHNSDRHFWTDCSKMMREHSLNRERTLMHLKAQKIEIDQRLESITAESQSMIKRYETITNWHTADIEEIVKTTNTLNRTSRAKRTR